MRLQAPTRSAASTAADHGAATPWVPIGRTVVPLAAAAVFIVGQLYVVIPLIGAFASGWGASASQTAWMVTAFGFAYATGLLFTGPAADRFDRRRVLLSGLVAAALATAALGLAADLTLRVVQGFTVGASLGPQLAAAADGAGFIGVCTAAGALLAAGMLTALAARRIRRRPA